MNNSKSNSMRIGYYDFLKVIGLSGIILAHAGSPSLIMMIRSFDVPLMVLISSILAKRSYDRYIQKNIAPMTYCVSRVKRLVFPTWIFLTIYFVIYVILSGHFESIHYYFASYALTKYGIDYVWIILIYLYCSLLVPLFNKMPFTQKNILIIISVYIIYEIGFYFGIGTDNKIIMTTFYYIVPYGALAYLGYNYEQMKQNTKYYATVASFLIFIILCAYYWYINGSLQLVSIVKFPPRLYYLSYGLFCSFLMLLLCKRNTLKIYNSKIIQYISMHSMWIYLWHILVLTAYDVIKLPSNWYIKFFIVYIGAILIVVIINMCLDKIEKKHTFAIFKYLRG